MLKGRGKSGNENRLDQHFPSWLRLAGEMHLKQKNLGNEA